MVVISYILQFIVSSNVILSYRANVCCENPSRENGQLIEFLQLNFKGVGLLGHCCHQNGEKNPT